MNSKARERRFRRIKEIGCLPCLSMGLWRWCEIHHQNLGGVAGQRRLGDEYTVGLCVYHHQAKPLDDSTVDQCRLALGPSLHEDPIGFRAQFGTDEQLLTRQNELIRKAERRVVGRAS